MIVDIDLMQVITRNIFIYRVSINIRRRIQIFVGIVIGLLGYWDIKLLILYDVTTLEEVYVCLIVFSTIYFVAI